MTNKSKPKVLIALGSDFHSRSFFSGDLFETLSNMFETRLVFSQDVNSGNFPVGGAYTVIPPYSMANRLFVSVLDAGLIRNLPKSTSFRFRVKRMLFGDYKEGFPLRPRGTLRFLRGLFFSTPGPFFLLNWIYLYCVRANQPFQKIVLEFKPDIVMCWAQTNEPLVVHATLLAQDTDATSVVVFDNWDNLCSKSVILVKPDHIICFGYQAQEHAVRIHGLSPEHVHALGSARFDSYLRARNSIHHARCQVLIAGSSIAMEDDAILRLISRELLVGSLIKFANQFKFLYRPHPFPQGSSINLDLWEYHPIIPGSRIGAWQDQKEVAKELSLNKLVVSAPTTLLLESLLAGSWVIVPSLPVVNVKTNTQEMLLNLEHLRFLDKLQGVTIATSEEMVVRAIQETLESMLTNEISGDLEYFVVTGPESFAVRLTNFLIQLT